jgi:hypothetical integral membrane protein (TIGR02206 family)
MSEFHSFSLLHATMVAALAAFTWLIIWLHRRWQGSSHSRMLDLYIALAAVIFWCIDHGRWLAPSVFDPTVSLPLNLCNLAGVCVPIALLTRSRPFRALLYFWGIGLSTQSIITPDLVIGPRTFGFWMYWINHTIVIGTPIYDVVARGYRPTWRDYGFVVLVTFVYAVVMIPVDIALHANYGYLGAGMTKQASVLDFLGPWPLRVVWICLLAALVMALLMLPWLHPKDPLLSKIAPAQHNRA